MSAARPRTRRLRALTGALLLLVACGEGGSTAASTDDLRPGNSLLDEPARLVVEQLAASNLPGGLPAAATGVLVTRAFILPPEAWELRDEPVRADELPPRGAGPAADYRRWVARPALRLDLGLGDQWLSHRGEPATPHVPPRRRGQDMTQVGDWTGADDAAHFRWHPESGELHVLAKQPPGRVEYGYRATADNLMAYVETSEPAPPTAEGLVRRITLESVDRPAVLAPAPSVLSARVRPRGHGLRVAVGALRLGFDARDGQLVRDDARSDGTTFAVEVEADGERERLWSRHVTPDEGFVEAVVDLSAHTDRTITLRFLTEPGPAGDPVADYAVWSALRLVGTPRQPPSRPHVLYIDADTLRADRLGMYGAERPTSPRLDAWAAREAVVYEQGRAAANWTLPSTVSMLTGLSVTQHGVREFPRVLTAEAEPLALRLKQAGYDTYGRTDGGFVNAAFGFHLGFDVFDFNAYPHHEHYERGWKDELRRLRERGSEHPVFYFLQTYMVHAPYMQDRRFDDPEAPYDGPFTDTRITQQYHKRVLAGDAPPMTERDWEYLRALYDAGVRRMDDVVMDFLDGAAEVFGDEPYLVIFTSDHGEELADHGLFGHGHTLFREQLFVPFVLRFPDARAGRSDAPVSSLDLVPTVLDLVGLEIPEHLPGRSLARPAPDRRLLVAEDGELSAAFLDGWKLLSGRSRSYGWQHEGESLYRMQADPLDSEDVAAENAQIVAALRRQLEDFHARHPARVEAGSANEEVDPALVEQLKALGYLGGDEDH